MFLFLHHAHSGLLEFGDTLSGVWNVESYVMKAFAMLGNEFVHERFLVQRLEQFDYRAGEVELGEAETCLAAFIVVHEGRAEHSFPELSRLGDAFYRDSDVIEFADRLLAHFLTKAPKAQVS